MGVLEENVPICFFVLFFLIPWARLIYKYAINKISEIVLHKTIFSPVIQVICGVSVC